MRNEYNFKIDSTSEIISKLLSISKEKNHIAILHSNKHKKNAQLPPEYIKYDMIAGVDALKVLKAKDKSFIKFNSFFNLNKDWMFGYISYDLKNEIEDLLSENKDNIFADHISFFIPKYVLLVKQGKLKVLTHSSKKTCTKFIKSLNNHIKKDSEFNIELKTNETRSQYLNKIRDIKKYIKKGEVYEMNYCQEFYAKNIEIYPEELYYNLNDKMLSPFSSFVKINEHCILSFSPERFLKKQNKTLLSQPIKGTIKRGINSKQDKILINTLKGSKKDIIENVMITDLVRNDLSKISLSKSVEVDELCKIYSFENVHQMISTIKSKISKDISLSDIIIAAFPMGSMTGAPKLRAMELIEYFETFRRGIYSGSIGYVTPFGDFDFNVVIRSIIYNKLNKYLSVGVGGAITHLSKPEAEYEECLLKIKPIVQILKNKKNAR